jgi:diamine N-acetyltransferase
MTATICLRPITSENWIECINLKPTAQQQEAGFVASNAVSLAQAYGEPWWQPYAIYADQTMVGFVMYGRWPASGVDPLHDEALPGIDCILRFMIDERYQGRGYGRAAMEQAITQIKAQPDVRAIHLSYEPDNVAAARLYTGVGFRPTGRIVGGEEEAWLSVDESYPMPHDKMTG